MLKKLFSSITLVALVGMLVAGLANAATSTVTATVTVKYASLSLNRSSFAYGSMNNNTASSTVTLWSGAGITATNSGSASDFDIYSTATTTGSNGGWALAADTTGNNYIHRFCKDTDVDCTSPPTGYTGNELTTSPQTLKAGVAAAGTYVFQLEITTPTTPTDFTQQSAVVTVQASAT